MGPTVGQPVQDRKQPLEYSVKIRCDFSIGEADGNASAMFVHRVANSILHGIVRIAVDFDDE